MSKAKKIEKDYTLSDSTVNCYGFRLLTEGYLIDEYKKNPIGYYMHDRNGGVVLKWEDLRKDGDKVVGKPVINLSNPKGQQLVEEVENGFLNGASVGHIVAVEWSEDPKLMLPGQTGPTITKWYNRECSLCDVPGNMNALALYDKEGNQINLANFKTKTTILNMEKITLTAPQLVLLGLKADSDAAAVEQTIKDLVAKAAKVDQLTTDLAAATTAKKTAEDALATFKSSTLKAEADAAVDDAVTKTCITKEQGDQLKNLFAEKPAELKAYVKTLKPYSSVTKDLSDAGEANPEVAKLMAKTGDELFASNEFPKLKALSASAYAKKYKEWTGEEVPAAE